jgi:hypothetical protein
LKRCHSPSAATDPGKWSENGVSLGEWQMPKWRIEFHWPFLLKRGGASGQKRHQPQGWIFRMDFQDGANPLAPSGPVESIFLSLVSLLFRSAKRGMDCFSKSITGHVILRVVETGVSPLIIINRYLPLSAHVCAWLSAIADAGR